MLGPGTMVRGDERQRRLIPVRQSFRDIYEVALHPGDFYERLSRKRTFASAMGFLLLCSVLFTMLEIFYLGQRKPYLALIYFSNAFLMPFITAFFLYLVTLPLCKRTYTCQSLLGITAYAQVTLLVAWIPGLAWMAGIWKFFLIGLGMVKVGRITGLKALLSLLATAVILLSLIQLLQPILRH